MTITATAPLDSDAEVDLVLDAQAGSEAAMTALVQAHVRFIRSEARKYARAEPLLEADDLISAGLEGLMEAVRSFDPARGVRLLTHAHQTIALKMAEEVATTGRTITVPGRSLRKYRRALRETDSLEAARALAHERDGMTPETFDSVHFAMTGGTSLDASFENGDRSNANGYGTDSVASTMQSGVSLGLTDDSNLLGSRGPAPEGTAVSRSLARQALSGLGDREREIVTLAYLSGEDLSDAAIAARLGVSRPTVTRTRNAALEAMRDALEA